MLAIYLLNIFRTLLYSTLNTSKCSMQCRTLKSHKYCMKNTHTIYTYTDDELHHWYSIIKSMQKRAQNTHTHTLCKIHKFYEFTEQCTNFQQSSSRSAEKNLDQNAKFFVRLNQRDDRTLAHCNCSLFQNFWIKVNTSRTVSLTVRKQRLHVRIIQQKHTFRSEQRDLKPEHHTHTHRIGLCHKGSTFRTFI